MKDETKAPELFSRFPATHARQGMATLQGLNLSNGTKNLVAMKWYEGREYNPTRPHRRNHTPIGEE